MEWILRRVAERDAYARIQSSLPEFWQRCFEKITSAVQCYDAFCETDDKAHLVVDRDSVKISVGPEFVQIRLSQANLIIDTAENDYYTIQIVRNESGDLALRYDDRLLDLDAACELFLSDLFFPEQRS